MGVAEPNKNRPSQFVCLCVFFLKEKEKRKEWECSLFSVCAAGHDDGTGSVGDPAISQGISDSQVVVTVRDNGCNYNVIFQCASEARGPGPLFYFSSD